MNRWETEIYFVVVAAGTGIRMGSPVKKQYIKINGVPVLSRTLSVFKAYENRGRIILVVPGKDIAYCRTDILTPLGMTETVSVVPGGTSRHQSVFHGIEKARTLCRSCENSIVVIHDGVRPLVDRATIDACIEGAERHGACVAAVKSVDTLKRAGKDKKVRETLDRSDVYQVQTPQAFRLEVLFDAYEQARHKGVSGTDDAALVEFTGRPVFVTRGARQNIKITTREDILIAGALLKSDVGRETSG